MKSIDVIIALYNGAPYIRETLDTVLAQTLKPNKIIVVDDGSTDGSVELVYDRPEIMVLKNPGKGACLARNHGLDHSRADFVAFLDHDDLWHPDHLRLIVNAFESHPEAQAAISAINYFCKNKPQFNISDQSFYVWDPWQSFPFISEDHSTSAMVFRRSKFKADGGWAERHGGQADYFAWYRSAIDAPAVKVKSVTLAYRKQLDSGWMSGLRKDVPALITSLIQTASDLIDINLAKKSDSSKEQYLQRRIAVYHAIYSLINNLKQDRDGSISQDIQRFEDFLADETPHFRKFFLLDLEYFIENLAGSEKQLKYEYLLKLGKFCPGQAVICQSILSTLIEPMAAKMKG